MAQFLGTQTKTTNLSFHLTLWRRMMISHYYQLDHFMTGVFNSHAARVHHLQHCAILYDEILSDTGKYVNGVSIWQ
jgi:hypothetical protein